MAPNSTYASTLSASISPVENGLFHATYHTNRPAFDRRQLPTYQVGVSLSEARRKIEESAYLIGFETILWDSHFDRSLE